MSLTPASTITEVVLYRTRITDIEFRADALLPDDLYVLALLPGRGDPVVRVGDRDLDYREAVALASAIAAAAATIDPDSTDSQTRFGRALLPGEMSAPTAAQQALARRRADLAAMLVGLVTGAVRSGDEQ